MRLLVDARVGWGHGIGRVVANTVPLIARSRSEWEIRVLAEPDDVRIAEHAFTGIDNVGVVPCVVPAFSLAEQVRLQRYAQGYDLTWFTNYWVPLGWRTPFVATVHDMLHLMPELLPASPLRRALSRCTFAKVRRDARGVIFVSRFTQDAFTRMVGAPEHGMAVSLGGDHLDYPPTVPVRERTRRLVVVAASKKHKNFAVLLDAWKRAQVPGHWTLTIVSPDAMFRSSIDLDFLASGSRRVEIRRSITNEELAALYGDSAVLLMPSRYEGFGLPLLEGMLAGAMCVSSNAGAMVEVAQGAFVQFVNGTDLAGWTTAIEKVCALVDGDGSDLDALAAHNIAHAQDFRWSKTAAGIVQLLETARR